ncbi:hypothetical protein [Formosa maritima]|uniref:Uncharacterized protein n=1 Tax=Formosa maritima TaxID=2592046 RepID=A0A5D0G1J5_9FLAO|nr:hypothetical protein [Formosa maritima]TYA52430.1 hypothetical protein FVF61_13920 [Formosa maritima]
MRKKIIKFILYLTVFLTVILFGMYGYAYYVMNYKFMPSKNTYTKRVAYIDPDESLLSEGFETCNDYIFDYYNPERATYSKGKNGLRNFILTNYKNNNYNDSGYLNIRFVINCKGQAGRYVIYENDLDLEPTSFNKDLVNQLFHLTTQLKDWNPNFTRNEFRDSYMYLSYRIEHGNITEIIP